MQAIIIIHRSIGSALNFLCLYVRQDLLLENPGDEERNPHPIDLGILSHIPRHLIMNKGMKLGSRYNSFFATHIEVSITISDVRQKRRPRVPISKVRRNGICLEVFLETKQVEEVLEHAAPQSLNMYEFNHQKF